MLFIQLFQLRLFILPCKEINVRVYCSASPKAHCVTKRLQPDVNTAVAQEKCPIEVILPSQCAGKESML